MIKIRLLGTLSLLCASILISANAVASSRDGVYFGAGVGGIADKYDFTVRHLNTNQTLNIPAHEEKNGLANVFLGYGSTADTGLYLAGELGTYFPSRSTSFNRPGLTFSNITFTDTMSVQDYVTFDLLPGYRLNETWLIYGRAGLSYSHMSLEQAGNILAGPYSFSENKLAGRIGAGINFAFTNNFGMGLDYFYTRYQEMDANALTYPVKFNQKLSSNFVGISALYTI